MMEENQKNLGSYHIDDLGKTATFFFPKDNQEMKPCNPSDEQKEINQNEFPSKVTEIKKSSQIGTKSPQIYSQISKDREQENKFILGREQQNAEGIRSENGSIEKNRRLNNVAVQNVQGLLDSRQTWRIAKNGSPQAKGQISPFLEREDYQSPPKKSKQINQYLILQQQQQQQFQSAPQSDEHQLPFDATFNFTAQQFLQRNMMTTKLPSISVLKNQQTIENIESSAQNSKKQPISSFSQNPKNMIKYSQIGLASQNSTIKQIGDPKNMVNINISLRNKKQIPSSEQPTLLNKQNNANLNKISSNNFGDALPMQNNSNSAHESPEMNLQNENIGSPGEQQKQGNRRGSYRNNQTLSPPTEDEFLLETNKITRGNILSLKGDGQMRNIGQSALNRQISPDPETKYSSLKTYLQENYNSGQGQGDIKKQNSISSIQMQKKFQLDPIKAPISLGGGGTLDTINHQSQTKKFLTRKPQTKILNRVFSSKADIKPNKNIVLKNIPQTANSLQTIDSPLFVFESELNHAEPNRQNGSKNSYQQNAFQDQNYNKIYYGSNDTTINSNYQNENGFQMQNHFQIKAKNLKQKNSNNNINDLLHEIPITKNIRPRFQQNQPKFFSAPYVNKEPKDQDTIQQDQNKMQSEKSSFDSSFNRTLNGNTNNIKIYPFNQLHQQHHQTQKYQQGHQYMQQRAIQNKSRGEVLNNIPQNVINKQFNQISNFQSLENYENDPQKQQQLNNISINNHLMPETLQQLQNFKIQKATFKPFNLQSTLKKN